MRKLRFRREGVADRHAVAAAGQFAALVPDFEGMRKAGIEQRGIGAHDPRRDPGEMPAAGALSGAGRDHALEVAVEGHRVAGLAHLPAQPLGKVQFVEEEQRALRRRPPFRRSDMAERIKPAPVGGDQRRHRQVMRDAGKAGRPRERALGIGQGIIGRQQLAKAELEQIGHAGDARRHQRPGEPQRPALDHGGERLAEQRGAPVGAGGRAESDLVGMEGQSGAPGILSVAAVLACRG